MKPIDWGGEPSLDELLNDPITHLIMRRDAVAQCDLRRMLDLARDTWRKGARRTDSDMALLVH